MLKNNALANKMVELKGEHSYREMSDKTKGLVSHSYFNTLINGDSRTKEAIKPSPEKLRIIAQAYPFDTSYSELMKLADYDDKDITEENPNGLTDSQRQVAYFVDPNATKEEVEQIKKLVEIAKLSRHRL